MFTTGDKLLNVMKEEEITTTTLFSTIRQWRTGKRRWRISQRTSGTGIPGI